MSNQLKQIPFFAAFPESSLEKISNFLAERDFAAGEFIMREGEIGSSLYILKKGSADVLKQCLNGSFSHISDALQGSIIGEIAYFNDRRRSAHVIAKENIKALELTFDALEKLISSDPYLGIQFYHAITAGIIEKFKYSTVGLSELIASSRLIALGDLVSSIAHEINNPLTTIRLLVSQVEHVASLDQIDKSALLKLASGMDQAFRHVGKIIEGIKLASRNAQNDREEHIALKELIENTLQLCLGKLSRANIKTEISVFPLDLKLCCRPTHICQVILNLLSNSCDAVEGLEQRWIRIEAKEIEDWVEISVTDSGRGIPVELHDKLFAPFFSTKALGRGSGIGLSLSKRILESYQGTLFLNLESPHTCFKIQLPKNRSF